MLVDAHSDASRPGDLDGLRAGLRSVLTIDERDTRIRAWRREGRVQSFDWILPLMPSPVKRVVWLKAGTGERDRDEGAAPGLPAGFDLASLEDLERHLPHDLPVVVTIDLDSFTGLPAPEQARRFSATWTSVLGLPRITSISFAISRPWLADDAEASRLVLLALRASLALGHASVRFEPFGLEGPDRSERAKAYYRDRKAPSRFDPDSASPELRSLLLANADRLDVRLDRERWGDLLARWRSETSAWQVTVDGVGPDSDGVRRVRSDAAPALHLRGGLPGRVRSVTWLKWTPKASSYNVLPDLPSGKRFTGAAPPVMEHVATVIARTSVLSLSSEVWMNALPGPEQSGVLRISAELETDTGTEHTSRIELRRSIGSGFRAGLSEQFGLPYVFGAGFLRRAGLTGPDTGVGNDCANFLVYAWRRSGLRMPWSNPAQLRHHLSVVATEARVGDHLPIPGDAAARGLVVHLGSHVAALWEDRSPLGTLGPEDLLVHHLGGAPEVIALGDLLRDRERPIFDVYLGPSREPTGWIAVGGDVMPGDEGAPPHGVSEALRDADLALANLETTMGAAGPKADKPYVFGVSARRLSELRNTGVAAVSLANNHAGDRGVAGLAETLDALDANGLGHFGAGKDLARAVAPWYAEVHGARVAFVAASLSERELLPAGDQQPGIAVLPGHERQLAQAIASAKTAARSVIVLVHWGREGSTAVTDEQQRWARWFAKQGADAVVGSGPHVLQPYETVEGVPVFYSVGNLWFPGPWPSGSRRPGVAWIGIDARGRIVDARLDEILPDRRASADSVPPQP